MDELLSRADELADRFEAYVPSDDEHGEPPLHAVGRIAYQRSLLERRLLEAVRDARDAGASWSKIGDELGTSGEAARQRYARKVADTRRRPAS